MNKRHLLNLFWGFCLAIAGILPTLAQQSITTGSLTYTQNFNGLPSVATTTWTDNSTLPNWYAILTGTTVATTTRVDNGGSNSGGVYSYGTTSATDRALGSLASSSARPLYGVRFVNNTGATITSMAISYTGEQWRDGGAATPNAQSLTFAYLVSASTIALTTTGYTTESNLNFTSPTFVNTSTTAGVALDGNATANRTAKSYTIAGLSITNGQEIMLRWTDTDDSGFDHGLAIDDLSVTFATTAAASIAVSPTSLSLGSVIQGSPSTGQSISVTGTGLSNPITVTAPSNVEVSTALATGYTTSLTIANTGGTVYARLAGTGSGSITGNVSFASTGATTQNVAITGTVLVPSLSVSPTSLTGFSYTQGSGPSAGQSISITGTNLTATAVTVTGSTNYEVSTNNSTYGASINIASSMFGSPQTVYVRLKAGLSTASYNAENVVISGGGASSLSVSCSGTVVAPTPSLIVNPTTLNLGTTNVGTASTPAQSFTVQGLNLTNDVIIAAPSNVEISTSPVAGYAVSITLSQGGGIVPTSTLYARISAGVSVATTISGNITVNSTGATTQNIALSGTATVPPPVITVSPTSLNLSSTVPGTPATGQAISVTGANLTSNITITAPSNVEVSTSLASGYAANVTISGSGTVYARLAGTGSGSITGNVSFASTGATTQNVAVSGAVQSPSNTVQIYEVYGGGGNSGATYRNDYVVLRNVSGSDVSLAGWSLQYNSATSTTTTWSKTDLTGTIIANGYYLVQQSAGTGGTANLPTPDATGSLALSGTAGKIVLMSNTTALAVQTPAGANVVDFVGFGSTANASETSPAPAPSNTTAIRRNSATDTNNNATDFSVTGAFGAANALNPITSLSGILTDPTSLNLGTTIVGTPSTGQAIAITGASWLTQNITITAPTGVEISNSLASGYGNSLSLSSPGGTIYARLSAASIATISGNITLTSQGAVSKTVAITGTVTAPPSVLMVSPTTLSGFSYTQGSGPSVGQSISITGTNLAATAVTVTGSTNYEVSTDNATFGTSVNIASSMFGSPQTVYIRLKAGLSTASYNAENVVISGGGASNLSVSCSGAVVPPTPSIIVNPTSLNLGTTNINTAGTPQSFTVQGLNLTGDIILNAPSNVEISTSMATGYAMAITLVQGGGSVANITIFARIAGGIASPTSISGNITATSTGATTQNVAVSGSVVTPTPVITLSPTALNFGTVVAGSSPAAQTFTVTGTDISPMANISLMAPSTIEISTVAGSGYGSSVTLMPAMGAVASTTIYARPLSTLLAGTSIGGSISASSTGAVTKNVAVSGSVSGPCSGTLVSISAARATVTATVNSVSSAPQTVRGTVTAANEFGGRLIYIQDATGGMAVYSAVSPTIGSGLALGDLIEVRGTVKNFQGKREFDTPTCLVKISSGTALTPTVVTIGNMANYEGQLISINSATIGGTSPSFAGGTNYPLTAGGATGELRIDGGTNLPGQLRPGGSINVTGIADRFTSGATSLIQLLPRSQSDVPGSNVAGPEYVNCQTNTGGTLALSATNRSQTLDVVNWNTEWLGNPLATYGPSDEALQQANVKKVLQDLNADIYAIQEVSDPAVLATIVGAMTGGSYAVTCSNRFSYYFNPSDPYAQRLCFVYNTATVVPVPAETRALLDGNYAYTAGGSVNNWASGRLPFMFTADVSINGLTKRVHLVNIHGKSGSTAADRTRRIGDSADLKAYLDANYATNKNLIFLGDYNDDLDVSISTGTSSYENFVNDNTNYSALTLPLSNCGIASTGAYPDYIDHMMVSNEIVSGSQGIQYEANTAASYRPVISGYSNNTSDHYATIARFSLVAAPSISVTASMSAFASVENTASASQSYMVEGKELLGAITITAPTDFQVSTSAASGFGSNVSLSPSGYTVSPTTIYVRQNSATAGAKSGNISHTTSMATTINISVSGSVSPATCTLTATATISQSSVCSGQAVTLGVTTNATSATFSWAGNGFSSTSRTPTVQGVANSGIYTVTVVSSTCTITSTVRLTVSSSGSASTFNPTLAGGTISLSASGGSSYSWAGPGFTSNNQNPTRSNADASMAGVYTVTIGGNCGGVLTVNVVVSEGSTTTPPSTTVPPTTTVPPSTTPPTSTCSISIGNKFPVVQTGGKITLSVLTPATAYSWKGPDAFTSSQQNVIVFWPTVQTLQGVFSVTATVNGSCTASATTSVSVVGVIMPSTTTPPTTTPSTTTPPVVTPPVTPPSTATDLSLVIDVNFRDVRVGEVVRYAVLLRNPTRTAASNVPVTVTLPTGITYESGDAGVSNAGQVVRNTVSVPAESFVLYFFRARVNAAGVATATSPRSNTASVDIRLASTSSRLGVAEGEQTLRLFPNPSTGKVQVEIMLNEPSEVELRLLNMTGSMLMHKALEEKTTTHRTELDLSPQPAGIYLLEAEANGKRIIKKVLRVE